MTQPAPESPRNELATAQQSALATGATGTAAARRRPVNPSEFPAGTVIVACVALHLLAATLVYRDLARDLYALFDAVPRLLVLERGLVRLTAVSVFLPPIIPTALLAGATLWLGRARHRAEVARWLALAAVPLAIDSLLRAVGVLIAPPPSSIGELLELPNRFSLGPRAILDLLDVHPGPGAAYWAVVCTVASAVSAWYVARAVLVADAADRHPAAHRRARGVTAIDALHAGTVVTGAWVGLAVAGQVALPWATQLFLRTFG
jgi:hypothetical protein